MKVLAELEDVLNQLREDIRVATQEKLGPYTPEMQKLHSLANHAWVELERAKRNAAAVENRPVSAHTESHSSQLVEARD